MGCSLAVETLSEQPLTAVTGEGLCRRTVVCIQLQSCEASQCPPTDEMLAQGAGPAAPNPEEAIFIKAEFTNQRG